MNKSISPFTQMAVAVLATLTLLSPTAFAADPPVNPRPAPGADAAPPVRPETPGRARAAGGGNNQGGRGNFAGGLNLDDKQRELLREATQKEGDELRKLNEKLQAAQKELVQAVVAEKYDEKVVRGKADAVSKVQTEITMLRARAFATVSPTLKPEQREQLDNPQMAIGIIMSGGGFGGGRMNFGGPGGPGGPDGQPPSERVFRRRDAGNGGPAEPDQPRRRGGQDQ